MAVSATDNLEPDRAAVARVLAALTRAPRGPVEVWPRLDSTNAELLRRVAGQPDRAVLIADAQSAGRGRLGRAWLSPPGANLYLSMFLRHPEGRPFAPGLALALGVAACEAVRGAGFEQAGLKWPNDLLAAGRKLGGILIESVSGLGGVVAGIGINLRLPPELVESIGQPVASLADFGEPPARDDLAAALIDAWNPAADEFALHGWTAFRSRWQALDAFAQQPVRVRSGGEVFEGTALGVDDEGRLLLQTGGTLRAFVSAETSLRPA